MSFGGRWASAGSSGRALVVQWLLLLLLEGHALPRRSDSWSSNGLQPPARHGLQGTRGSGRLDDPCYSDAPCQSGVAARGSECRAVVH